MQNISVEQLLTFCAVGVVLIGIYNSVITATKNHREEQRRRAEPTMSNTERLNKHDEFLASDKRRIELLEQQAKTHDEEMKLLLSSQLALLRHGIDGNNIQGLKDSQTAIQQYLVNR